MVQMSGLINNTLYDHKELERGDIFYAYITLTRWGGGGDQGKSLNIL